MSSEMPDKDRPSETITAAQRPNAVERRDEEEAISFAEFLESVPPDQRRIITALTERIQRASPVAPTVAIPKPQMRLQLPEIRLHCSNENCNGMRFFREAGDEQFFIGARSTSIFLGYKCSNCQKTTKVFALFLTSNNDKERSDGTAYKFGEYPVYGPPTPSRLISLIGPDRELFLKGRRSENHGLGIGAFGYYRRVVENQKNRILDSIIKVSEKLGAAPEVVTALKEAQKETQFSKAVEAVKAAIPQTLLINGHNPLTLLHSALSDGLHAQTDERCLEIAHDIRIILAELSDRLVQALKDEVELNDAVTRLLNR
jgi:hypothetical protein